MWKTDSSLFNELAERCGSRYLAVLYVAKAARHLAQAYNVSMIESQLISWALTGNQPDINLLRYQKVSEIEFRNIEDFLSYVEDVDVKRCVLDSYRQSVKQHHLIYQHSTTLDQYQCSRVDILLRMVWWDTMFMEGE